MTAEKVKKWVVAVLKDSADVRAVTGSPAVIRSEDDELLTTTGVAVGVDGGSRAEQFADVVQVRLRCYHLNGEQNCWNLMAAVDRLLTADAGRGSPPWTVSPGSKGVRVKSVAKQVGTQPERDGPNANGYAGTLVFEVTGRDASDAL